MPSILVIYGTGEGQTGKVADRLAGALEARGHETTTANVTDVDPDLDLGGYDALLVGASIHAGKHQKAVRRWAKANRDGLASKPNGFFQVSLSSADAENEESVAEAAGYVDEFVEASGWRPDRVGLFGGALRFSQYGFLLRALMKRFSRGAFPEGNVEASGDVEFTDWEEVDAFADAFATFVEERTGGPVEVGQDA